MTAARWFFVAMPYTVHEFAPTPDKRFSGDGAPTYSAEIRDVDGRSMPGTMSVSQKSQFDASRAAMSALKQHAKNLKEFGARELDRRREPGTNEETPEGFF